MHDYYKILGIPENADLATIKKAYRSRAFVYHPDHGGSHEMMLLINEAWYILSDSNARVHYDSARRNRDDVVVQRAAQEDSKYSKQKAREYPSTWKDFEEWLDKNYGTSEFMLGLKVPTGGNDMAKWSFIVAGGFAGLMFAASIVETSHIRSGTAGIVAPLTAGGAWLGVMLHYAMSKKK